ncbi:MAG TPA: sodium-translocating pyrophosphatase [Bryobacteraceae bacterium]|nr:sodium-translocating pyrophosphatase [Bryobacteraceae bacterium]
MLAHTDTNRVGRLTGLRSAAGARTAPFLRIWLALLALWAWSAPLMAQEQGGGEANLVLPDLHAAPPFVGGISGVSLLMSGMVVSALGLVFGLTIFVRLRNMPVHTSMREVSELIYETCKTYLATQGKFLLLLEVFIAVIIIFYFGFLQSMGAFRVLIILLFSVIGISGSFCVAAFGMRVNTFANSRTAFASLTGKAFPCYDIPLQAGMSIGMLLVSVELLIMLFILLFVPGALAGPCFIGFAIGESLGAAALRVAGGIFTKIADIGSDLMKIVFKIKEDDARNPGVIADCTGDNAGDSVGPSADGFETYGVTGVALITFILLAVGTKNPAGEFVANPTVQVQLLVWIFSMRVMMVVSSAVGYFVNGFIAKRRFGNAAKFNFETPLTTLVWITSLLSIALTYVLSSVLIPELGGDSSMWWKLATVISCGTLAGALIPEFVKVFTSTNSRHVREIVTSSREGGASLNILSGFVAGNFSAYWLGFTMLTLMSIGYLISTTFPTNPPLMLAPAVFAFGLVAFGFLGMGPVTIAVDSYGPVTDNAQSIYELSTIETLPNIKQDIQKNFGFAPNFEKAKDNLEENDGAGNTFKATSKPVLIGTAVVGATTMIFSTIVKLTHGLEARYFEQISLMHAPFLLGIIAGGAVIFWFTGASAMAVTTGAYRAVEFIKANIKLESSDRASVADSKKVVEICTRYAQKGMLNIFLVVFFATLAFAFLEPFFFVGYLISIALFGLYQALFMADAGGAWDNAKKVVETELRAKGTPLHDACVVGDTVGDPFKDTSSVALNPIIKFTTLFGLLAVSLAVELSSKGTVLTTSLAAVFFVISAVFVYRSFYGMRIESAKD